MESKHKQKEVRGLLKDFAVYAKRHYPASTELVRRFKKNKDTRASRKHVEAIVHMLQLDMRFMEDRAQNADRGFFHMCRDVVEWVYGTNKSFSGAPSGKITRDWIHEEIQRH